MIKKINTSDKGVVKKFVEEIAAGGVVCFKSDTVYALACDATNGRAIESIYKIKNRDTHKPIAIYVNNLAMAERVFEFDELLREFCGNNLPGFLTIITNKLENGDIKISEKLNVESNRIGFRIIENSIVNDVIKIIDRPLAVTSANPSGFSNILEVNDVMKSFSSSEILFLDSGNVELDTVSTVVDYQSGFFRVLRQGKFKFN